MDSYRSVHRFDIHDEDAFVSQIYSVLSDGTENEDLSSLLVDRERELGITEKQATHILGFKSITQLRRLKQGETQKIDALTLVKLANYLELGVDGLARVLVAKMTPEEIGQIERTRANHFIARTFDVKGLRSIGFISDHNDFEAIERRLINFFGLKSLYDYKTAVIQPMFMARRISFKDEMRTFWVEGVRYQFQRRPNPFPFDAEQLIRLVPQIRQYTRHETGLLTVAKALYRAGITVIAQPYIRGTAIHGATFILDEKPYIVLTDLGKKYPAVWFALLHELAHVMYDWDQLIKVVYHLSGEDDTLLREPRANYVASELLLPSEKLDYIKSHLGNSYLVGQYARQNDLHPSIIYWLHARREYEKSGDGKEFAFYSKEINVDPSAAIRALKCYPWDKETVDDEINRIIDNLRQ